MSVADPAAGGGWLDPDDWSRRAHFEHFRAMPYPWFSLTVQVDAPRLWHASREPGGPSFFLATLFLAMRAANATRALRLRLRGEKVWIHDRIHASSTILRPDDTFGFARLDSTERFADFIVLGRSAIERARGEKGLGGEPGRDDLIYHSTLPWLNFTAFSNPRAAHDDCIPRIVFGACTSTGSGWHMPMSVEVHHALVDGLDVARFVERFQSELSAPALD